MKVVTFVLSFSLLLAPTITAFAAKVAEWNFNSPTPDNDTSTGSTNASTGSGIASVVGAVNSSFSSGDTKSDSAPSADNSGWQTTHYPAVASTNKTDGVKFDVNTLGFENISISWYQRNSASASRYSRLQYTIDGTTFVDADVSAIYVDSVFTNKTVDLSSVPGVKDNARFGFRIVAEWENTASGSGTNAYVATKPGSNYSTAGTVRFEMVTVSGTAIAGANTPPSISTVSNQTIRVNQSTAVLPITITDAEDAPNSLILAKASSDSSVINESDIVFGGTGNNRTVKVTGGSQTGSATVTLSVIDTGGRSNTTSFTVLVLPLNTAPVISNIPRLNTLMNTTTGLVSFTIGDLETSAGSLSLNASSANPALVPSGNVIFGGAGSNRTATVIPVAGQAGVAPLTITVSDGTNTASSVFPVMVAPTTEVVFYDPFSYSDGSLLTNSAFLWGNRSGTLGQCQVTNSSLLISSSLSEDVVAVLVGAPFAKSNATVLYASFDVKLSGLPKATPDYFAHFASGSTLRGRLYVGITNTTPGYFRFFVSNSSDTNAVPLSRELAVNTVYKLVMRFDIDSASTTIWVNPAAESDTGASAVDAQSPVSISAFDFRESSDVGTTILVDNLKVGMSFDSVVLNVSGPPAPIPLVSQLAGRNLILSWSNPAFALQAAPAATGVYTNIPAATSPYTNVVSGPPKFFRLKF
jgi:hypothetical protein